MNRLANTVPSATSVRRSTGRTSWFILVRAVGVVGVCVAGLFAISLAGLLIATPSVKNAADLTRAYAHERKIPYPGPQPPPRFVKALVATEDHRFFSPLDPGVDPFAVVRAVIAGLTIPHSDPGGSTIGQQLAKMLYTPEQRGLAAKIERVGLAIKLHFEYSCAEILAMYAEMAYYGDGYYGLGSASCGYFGRPPAELTWAQAAMLAGVVNAPSVDDPRTHSLRARRRETHVLKRLVAVGDLTEKQAGAAFDAALGTLTQRHEAVVVNGQGSGVKCRK